MQIETFFILWILACWLISMYATVDQHGSLTLLDVMGCLALGWFAVPFAFVSWFIKDAVNFGESIVIWRDEDK